MGAACVGAFAVARPVTGATTPVTDSAEREYDVRKFGAKGDGKTLDTPAINKAIDAAAATGVGTVYFPVGSYLCYSIRLKSKIRLQLASGATIIAADPPEKGKEGFDLPESNKPWEDYQ